MQPGVEAALEAWREAFIRQRDAAVTVLRAAFPPLAPMHTPPWSLQLRLEYDEPHIGSGGVYIDELGEGRVRLDQVPQQALGAAFDGIYGPDWFDGAPDGITQAGPGSYEWIDETTEAAYEIVVHPGGTATLGIGYANVPDTVTVLDALHSAHRQEAAR